MTTPAPAHPSYDLSFLGHLFTAASQVQAKEEQEKESGQSDVRQQTPLADQHPSSSPSAISDGPHEANSSDAQYHIHHQSPASISVSSSLTGPSGSSPVSPIAPPARPSVSHIPVQLSENEQCIRLRFNLKGIKNSDIYVGVQHGILMVKGTRFVRYDEGATAHQDNGSGVVQRHQFCRRFAIDTDVVDITKIQAKMSSAGVLTVVGPKKSSPSSVRVNVTEEHEDTQVPEAETTIVSFLLDQVNASASRDNGAGGAVSVSSFSGCHSSGSHSSGSEDDETMAEDTTRSSAKDTSSQ